MHPATNVQWLDQTPTVLIAEGTIVATRRCVIFSQHEPVSQNTRRSRSIIIVGGSAGVGRTLQCGGVDAPVREITELEGEQHAHFGYVAMWSRIRLQ